MFPNLNAEQTRHDKTNADLADVLQMSRVTFEAKKREGRFMISEADALCRYFGCDYAYLFSKVPLIPTAWKDVDQ